MFEIGIRSLREMYVELLTNDDIINYDIISIRDSKNTCNDSSTRLYKGLDNLRNKCHDMYISEFDDVNEIRDINEPNNNVIYPSMHEISNILKFSMNKERLRVHCTAGISRSSAISYGISCMHYPVKKAIKLLDIGRHFPNRLVVEYISEYLNSELILEEYLSYCTRYIRYNMYS